MRAIFLALFLLSACFGGLLEDFDKDYYYANKTVRLGMHQRLKSLYVKSIIQGDENLKKAVLRRLVISCDALGLSKEAYVSELSGFGISSKNLTLHSLKPTSKEPNNTTHTNDTKTKIQTPPKNLNDKKAKNQRTINQQTKPIAKPQPVQPVEKKPETTNVKTNHTKKISKKTLGNKQGVQIDFSYAPEDIKSSTYNNSAIFSLPAALDGGRVSIQNGAEFKIVQFDPKTLRIVVANAGDVNYEINHNSLFVYQITQQNKTKSTNSAKNTPNKNPASPAHTRATPTTGKYHASKTAKPSKPILPNPPIGSRQHLLITIDAGHGGKDSGALGHGRKEKDITLSIAKKLNAALRAKGYKTILTRNKDVFIGLRDRTKIANDKKSDLFISIHANSLADRSKADKISGIETYFLSPARSERSKNAAAAENKSDIEEMNYFSKQTFLNFLNREKIIASNKLAIDIQAGILGQIPRSYKVRDGGVKEAPFWVLVGALMPAVLIEVGYITHPQESANIASAAYQDKLVGGIVNGIENYFKKNKFF